MTDVDLYLSLHRHLAPLGLPTTDAAKDRIREAADEFLESLLSDGQILGYSKVDVQWIGDTLHVTAHAIPNINEILLQIPLRDSEG